MGRFGLGARNAEGNRIMEFTQGMEMTNVNTFEKKKEHKIAYKSGGRESQKNAFRIAKQKDRVSKDVQDAKNDEG